MNLGIIVISHGAINGVDDFIDCLSRVYVVISAYPISTPESY